MRQKRAKQYKRHMTLYHISFGFREPYQILVDSSFLLTVATYKIDIKTLLPKVMQGVIKHMYTLCVFNELKSSDQNFVPELLIEGFERRGCPHRKKPVSSDECLASIIGSENQHRYCIATQNRNLREQLRAIPGVPLIYINRTVLILEPPSNATLEKAREIERLKTLPSQQEILFLHKANPDATKNDQLPNKRKLKRPKGPNPLSCKKKKKKEIPPPKKKRKKELKNEEGGEHETRITE
ncbi:9444_t:CDS:2 [Paraglomus brasilianum]|uniref:U three protein 23 n=1 Tax=Paraglomus brasilianum TaxID=144538 RepID=A0A9N9BGM8_9GLOM|nr:9444_t:CDS:2 [Paraglomus brasilianum]